jgi:hypothetical protein
MSVGSVFQTTTTVESPLDGSKGGAAGSTSTKLVSDFLTVQALTNFAVMTGAIATAWLALQKLDPARFSTLWVPYGFAACFGIVSIITSWDGLKNSTGGKVWGQIIAALFVAVINALVLASAVVGASVTVAAAP